MLVKARRLFDKDVKLTAAQLKAQPPLIGRLRYEDNQYAGRDGRGPRKAMLLTPEPNSATTLAEIHSAKIKIDDRGIRIRGEEDEWRRKERTTYQQVLWCVPIREDELAPPQMHPDDLEEQIGQLRSAQGPTYGMAGRRSTG